MPTYQYACTACGHQLEAVQSFTDDPLTDCPQCEGRLRKVYSSVGIVFKGSGFYRTDSRNESRNGANGASSSSASSDSGSAKSDSSSTSGSNSSSGGKQPAASSTN